MKIPKFSIIIPVYNVEQYLERCLESVLAQDYENMEVILVDDGSKDKSGMQCDCYAGNYPWIKVIHKENGGLSSARNAGLEMATGDYVFFLDSDDFIEANMCWSLADYLLSYPGVDVISIDGYEETEFQRHMRRIPFENLRCINGEEYLISRYSQRNMNVEAWLYLFKRDFLMDGGFRFVEGILHEDVEFTPRVIEQARQILEVPDAFYHYVVREGSISTRRDKTKNIRDLFCTLEQTSIRAQRMTNKELGKWTKEAVLNSYLSMVQDAGMYKKKYRHMLNKRFVIGKAATLRNHLRVALFLVNVRLYCALNDWYKMGNKCL